MDSTRNGESSTSSFNDVPQELVDRICNFVDMDSLKSLRHLNKAFHASATKALFRHVKVLPTKESTSKCLALMESPELSPLVASIAFNTSLNPAAEYGDEDEDAALVRDDGSRRHIPSFYKALRQLSRFPKLQHVAVNFMERCAAGGDLLSDAPEDVAIRMRVINALTKNAHELPATFRGLDLRNLQNYLPDSIAESEGWKTLLGKIDALGLMITSESDDAAPERNLEYPELHEFYGSELQTKILEPVREQLRELKLCGLQEYRGYYPFLDLRDPGLHFPKLETMVLSSMSFVFDWQVEWILSHASTLKALILDDCPIFIAGRAFENMENRHVCPPSNTSIDDTVFWTNPTRWHTLFRLFKDHLPHLTHFAVRTSPTIWLEQAARGRPIVDSFTQPYAMENLLDVSRYRLFDAGVGPGQVLDVSYPNRYREDRDGGCFADFKVGWWDAELDESVDEELKTQVAENTKFPSCWKEDAEALEELMRVVNARR